MPLSSDGGTQTSHHHQESSNATSLITMPQQASLLQHVAAPPQPPPIVNYEYTTSNIPAFLNKLWTLVEDPKYKDIIAWDVSGYSFHVYDQTRFAREILPRFFKHNNMASFIRQLNMYGFRKVNNVVEHGSAKDVSGDDIEFHHPYFMRGKEQFLEFIKRKVSTATAGNNTNTVQQQQQQQAPATLIVQQQPQQQQPNAAMVASSNAIVVPGRVMASGDHELVELSHSKQLVKTDEFTKVLDDVNTMKSRQKKVCTFLFIFYFHNFFRSHFCFFFVTLLYYLFLMSFLYFTLENPVGKKNFAFLVVLFNLFLIKFY